MEDKSLGKLLVCVFLFSSDIGNALNIKEAEELVKGNLELFGRPDELKK